MDAERCVACGEIIPEGYQVCFACAPDPVAMEKLNFESNMGCVKCKRTTGRLTWHEPIMGHKARKLSIQYGLRVGAHWDCHEEIQTEPSQEFNKALQKQMQRKFQLFYPHLDFLKIFGRNYLTEDDQ